MSAHESERTCDFAPFNRDALVIILTCLHAMVNVHVAADNAEVVVFLDRASRKYGLGAEHAKKLNKEIQTEGFPTTLAKLRNVPLSQSLALSFPVTFYLLTQGIVHRLLCTACCASPSMPQRLPTPLSCHQQQTGGPKLRRVLQPQHQVRSMSFKLR